MTRAALAAAALAALLAACTTVPGSTERREASPPAEPADAARRAQVRMELASAYFARGQSATALDEVKAAIAAKPDLADAYNLRGLIYGALGDPKLAEESFQRALQLAPRDAGAMHNYGWFLCQQRRWAEADAQFAAALAQPQYRDGAMTLRAQGVCQAGAGRWAEAEQALMRSYEIDPSNPATAYNLAEVLYRRGDYERARFYVRRVNAVPEQTNAQSLWLAARIEQRLGNSDSAQDLGRRLSDRFPQSPEALQFAQGRFDE